MIPDNKSVCSRGQQYQIPWGQYQYQYLQMAEVNTQYQYQYLQMANVNTQYQYQYLQMAKVNTQYQYHLLTVRTIHH